MSRMKVVDLDPNELKIPPVRITSAFDEEIYAMFQDDIAKSGINQPLIIAKEGENLWVIDGKNRRDQALLQGMKQVPCVVTEMTLKDIQLRNLVLNRLRGKTKASEEIALINDLYKNHNSSIEEITEKTGMKRERVEMLIQISGVDPEVMESLDKGIIKLCHAHQISRFVDRDAQLRMLRQVETFRMKCDLLKGAVDDALRIIAEAEKESGNNVALTPPPVPTAECNICGQRFQPRDMASLIVCRTCYGIAITSYDLARKEVQTAPENTDKGVPEEDKSKQKTEGGP